MFGQGCQQEVDGTYAPTRPGGKRAFARRGCEDNLDLLNIIKLPIMTMEATDAAEATESVDTVPVTPRQPDLAERFEDLDDAEVYAKTKRLIANEGTKNFVVEFNYHTVNIAFDLNQAEMETLLANPAPKGMVRWM